MRWPRAAYLLVSRATASADIGVPLRVGNSGRLPAARCSAIHSARMRGVWRQRGAAVLAALAGAVDVRSGAEVGVMDGEAGHLGDPQPGLGGQRGARGHGGRASLPGRARRGGVELGGGEVTTMVVAVRLAWMASTWLMVACSGRVRAA